MAEKDEARSAAELLAELAARREAFEREALERMAGVEGAIAELRQKLRRDTEA